MSLRCMYDDLPFTKIPMRMLIELVYHCTFWLKSFPNYAGIPESLSPRTVITGCHFDYNKHCKLEFGEYVQAHEEHDNSVLANNVGAIAFRLIGNTQGTYIFYILNTGKKLYATDGHCFQCRQIM
jgi:hypothetical protein